VAVVVVQCSIRLLKRCQTQRTQCERIGLNNAMQRSRPTV